MDRLQTPPIVTSDFIYLRLIGDRRLAETQFGKIQIDRTDEIRNCPNNPYYSAALDNHDIFT